MCIQVCESVWVSTETLCGLLSWILIKRKKNAPHKFILEGIDLSSAKNVYENALEVATHCPGCPSLPLPWALARAVVMGSI